VAMGYDAGTVDAGYEWVGYHVSERPKPGSNTYGLTWYDDFLLPSYPCAILSNSPLDQTDLRLVRLDPSAYRQYLFFGPAQPLYLYGGHGDGCARAVAADGASGRWSGSQDEGR